MQVDGRVRARGRGGLEEPVYAALRRLTPIGPSNFPARGRSVRANILKAKAKGVSNEGSIILPEDGMTKITVNNHGPLHIEGECTIVDAEGRTFDLSGRAKVSLCRCGHSQNKPFCDGNHKRQNFQSEVKAGA